MMQTIVNMQCIDFWMLTYYATLRLIHHVFGLFYLI
jgi:hypothetical protein